jgi:aspartyl-tRNA(Asn)/glutamyl-tRNA(Gln) amidotransferase subunit A
LFTYQSVAQYHQALQKGITTCKAAVEHYLQRIKDQQHLNAYIEVFTEEARAEAERLDAGITSGNSLLPLHGVVIAIKDVLCYKGHIVTAASRILEGFTSIYHATAVERLLNAGAIIIGRLNCDEFAMGSSNENSAYGRVLNALDETRVPGGSSGGSAVAVQADLCMLSLGSDTGGSVRQPADFCGVVGMKPSYGRISRYGLIAYASSFDQIGVLAHSVEDIALVLALMAGSDDYDSTASANPVEDYPAMLNHTPRKYRIAYFEAALNHPALDPEIAAAVRTMIDSLRKEGHTIEPVDFEYLDYIVPAYYVLTTAEASSNLSRYDGVKYGHRTEVPVNDLTEFYKQSRSEAFGWEVKRRIMLGTFVLSAGYYDAYYTKAQQVRRLLSDTTARIFADYEAIIMPTVPATAFKAGEKTTDPIAMYIADIYTVYANLVGLPAISLPLFKHSNGLPFGLQVMTDKFKEVNLLQLSQSLMERKMEAETA